MDEIIPARAGTSLVSPLNHIAMFHILDIYNVMSIHRNQVRDTLFLPLLVSNRRSYLLKNNIMTKFHYVKDCVSTTFYPVPGRDMSLTGYGTFGHLLVQIVSDGRGG